MRFFCPCCSTHFYDECCEIYHQGQNPVNALALMRSRYSAYALDLSSYIIKTTHQLNPDFHLNKESWEAEIHFFCITTSFKQLEIIDFVDGVNEAYVIFIAHLEQESKSFKMKEKSYFKKEKGMWLYHSAIK